MSRPSRPPTFTSDSAARGGSGPTPHAPVLPLVDSLSQRLLAVCDALHFGQARTAEVESVFRTLIVPSTRLDVRRASTEAASWVSEAGAGNALIELAATLSPVGSELSVLFQPTGELPSPQSNAAAGMATFAEAARNFGAVLGRLERLSDLFLPEPQPCALWSAVAFAPGVKPAFKAYLKPQAGAAEQAGTLVEEALRRVGMSHAWAHVAETMMQRGRERDEVEYLAFDLTDGPLSSVELCVRHHDLSPDGHARETDIDGHTPRGQVAPFIRAMTGGAERLSRGATLTCAAFVAGSPGVPPMTTHYVPVGAYAESAAIVRQRVCEYLGCGALSAAPYRRALDAFIDNPFDASGGVPIWVAVSWCNGVPRFTFRLAAARPESAGSALIP